MPDTVITAPPRQDGNDGQFMPMPAGPQLVVCADVIDLGLRVREFAGRPVTVAPTFALVFQSEATNPENDNRPFEVSAEFTNSMHTKANLRKFLGNWRGKDYSDAEAAQTFDLSKLVGKVATALIQQRTSNQGREYSKISTVMPAGKGVKLAVRDYVRGDYWTQKRERYATEVSALRAAERAKVAEQNAPADQMPRALKDGDDDLPF